MVRSSALLFAFSCACAVASTAPAGADTPIAEVICAPTDQLERRLASGMGSARQATGLREPNEVFEVWTDARDNWTLVARYATGTSCIVAMGEHWARQPGDDPT